MPKKQEKTVIGDNVFIGMNSIILMGSSIGDNVIIGAGSVVSGSVPNNSVWAGNPVRQICTLGEFYEKRKRTFRDSAITQAKVLRKSLGRNPKIEEMDFFMPLFLEKNEDNHKKYLSKLERYSDSPKNVMDIEPYWNSYEDFWGECTVISELED